MNQNEIIIGRRYKHTDQSVDLVDAIEGDYVIATEVCGVGGRTPRPEWVRHKWLKATFTDCHTPVLPFARVLDRHVALDRIGFDYDLIPIGPYLPPLLPPPPAFPYLMFKIDTTKSPEPTPAQRVANAISDIAVNPSRVGLTHARIMRDEIVSLRSALAKAKEELARLNGVEARSNELLTDLAEANEELADRVMDVVEDVIGLRAPLDEDECDPPILRARLRRTAEAMSALDDLEPVITKLRQREIEALADE